MKYGTCHSAEPWDWDYLVQQDRIHRLVYTDAQIFQAEMTRIFGGTWVYLAHESEIPERDNFKTGRLGMRPIIVVRDRKGKIRCLLNRCTHRGATVCRQKSGSAKTFVCPYHGWTFSNNGKLAGIPWEGAYSDEFERTNHSLGQVPRVESYRGFIFGTLNLEAPDLVSHLGRAKALLDEWIDRYPNAQITVRSSAHKQIYNGNWKFIYDNAADGYHVNFSHRSLLEVARRLGEEKDMQYFARNPDDSEMYVQYLGNGHVFLDQRPSYPDKPGAYWQNQRPQPGREPFEASIYERWPDKADYLLDLASGSQMNLTIFPNLLIVGNQINVIEPLCVDRTQQTTYATTIAGLPDEINTLRMRTQEDFPNFGVPDDMMNFAECHQGLTIPEMEWVLINRGFGIHHRQQKDPDGIITAPVTDEVPIRSYYQEWKRLMSSNLSLSANAID
ncbi:MAG: aromatic ring-hydroxylating dioxygenase subunit alpha [Cyanobacteria bacterium P01_D01_bin.1]